ncbi:MAG: ABC transporter ATP-binding protein [Lachnospiraceae bacterium]|nr:ABC transporter ATP-binding protein [Lachnospiraceae bacterium]
MDVLVNGKKTKLQARDISKQFDAHGVLRQVSFEVADGEFLSLLGPSGCGKTTLLRILIGLLAPDTGTIEKDGRDITHAPPDKRGMGIVFQNYALFENMNVFDNVAYALRRKKETRDRADDIAQQMLEAVGLKEYMKRMPARLSGGQQQRVAIARTLALQPDIVLFDEPMSALDAATRLSMRAELKRLQERFGTTMIYVTHDQEEAFALSDRIMILDEGRIAQIDTPEEICAHPADEYVQTFVLDNLKAKIDSLSRFEKVIAHAAPYAKDAT